MGPWWVALVLIPYHAAATGREVTLKKGVTYSFPSDTTTYTFVAGEEFTVDLELEVSCRVGTAAESRSCTRLTRGALPYVISFDCQGTVNWLLRSQEAIKVQITPGLTCKNKPDCCIATLEAKRRSTECTDLQCSPNSSTPPPPPPPNPSEPNSLAYSILSILLLVVLGCCVLGCLTLIWVHARRAVAVPPPVMDGRSTSSGDGVTNFPSRSRHHRTHPQEEVVVIVSSLLSCVEKVPASEDTKAWSCCVCLESEAASVNSEPKEDAANPPVILDRPSSPPASPGNRGEGEDNTPYGANEEENGVPQLWVRLPCKHTLHYACLHQWITLRATRKLSLSCPICRAKISDLLTDPTTNEPDDENHSDSPV